MISILFVFEKYQIDPRFPHNIWSLSLALALIVLFENLNSVGCAYLNGWGAIIGVQMFALIGLLFSIATLGDCSFFELDERLFLPSDLDEEDLPLKVTQTGYVGLLTWQMLDG